MRFKTPVPSGSDGFDTKISEILKFANFFVFQNCALIFSGIFSQVLIRSFPGSFCEIFIPGEVPSVGMKSVSSKSQQYLGRYFETSVPSGFCFF